jgi:L-amino acid N-acyltransferase YncA
MGYAYASPFKDRVAYQWTAEVSVYIAPAARRTGLERALYGALFRCPRAQGFVNAVGLIAQPNDASIALHQAMGFTRVAWLPNPGFKLGRWHHVGWWWLALSEPPDAPHAPRALADCRHEAARSIAGA